MILEEHGVWQIYWLMKDSTDAHGVLETKLETNGSYLLANEFRYTYLIETHTETRTEN